MYNQTTGQMVMPEDWQMDNQTKWRRTKPQNVDCKTCCCYLIVVLFSRSFKVEAGDPLGREVTASDIELIIFINIQDELGLRLEQILHSRVLFLLQSLLRESNYWPFTRI